MNRIPFKGKEKKKIGKAKIVEFFMIRYFGGVWWRAAKDRALLILYMIFVFKNKDEKKKKEMHGKELPF